MSNFVCTFYYLLSIYFLISNILIIFMNTILDNLHIVPVNMQCISIKFVPMLVV